MSTLKNKKATLCACDSGQLYRECCRPLHRAEATAATAEQLMRSRYVAYVRKLYPYLHRTWAAETRPEMSSLLEETDAEMKWQGLEIISTHDGQAGDESGIVEFNAKYSINSVNSVLYERSLFIFRENSWFYLKPD